MSELAFSYATILKSEKQEDGTLKVYGKATDDSVDIDQQICDETWLQEAMPQWFQTGGNIREQHSNIAAGVATDYELKSDGHYITANVVDPVSVKKVEAGVLKGFSIGIRGPRVIRDNKAANGRIVGGQIVEVSLVDRPANPNAKLMLAKAAENGELMAVSQTPSPADIARAINKSENPIEAIVDAIENVVEDVVVVADHVIEDVQEIAPEIADVVAEIVADVEEIVADVNDAEKSVVAGDVVKFDADLFNTAIDAIGKLIAVEAGEAAQGHDESDSIKHLLKAIKHLKKWYQGEVEEGEVTDPIPAMLGHDHDNDEIAPEEIYMSADAKCEKCDMAEKDCKCADKSANIEVATNINVEGIIEKAVKSARDAVEAEIEQVKSATAIAEDRVIALEAELADALSKAAIGGPAKTATKSIRKSADVDQLLIKAADYRRKASTTLDRVLADGYRELAGDLEKKARKGGK